MGLARQNESKRTSMQAHHFECRSGLFYWWRAHSSKRPDRRLERERAGGRGDEEPALTDSL